MNEHETAFARNGLTQHALAGLLAKPGILPPQEAGILARGYAESVLDVMPELDRRRLGFIGFALMGLLARPGLLTGADAARMALDHADAALLAADVPNMAYRPT